MQNINIRCKNNNAVLSVPLGSTLREVYELSGLNMEFGPVSARVNNKVQGMDFRFYNSKDVEFLSLRSDSGMRVYVRTLFLVLAKAVEDLYVDSQLTIETPLSGGHYCGLQIGRAMTDEDVKDIKCRIQQIIDADMPISRIQCPIEDAVSLFRNRGMESKAQLLESQDDLYAYYYKLGDTVDYFYSCLMDSTGGLYLFDVERYEEGLLVRVPSTADPSVLVQKLPQTKMFDTIREYHRWQHILGVRTAGQVNAAVKQGRGAELINVSEALQERKLCKIVDEIVERGAQIVLLAGPSSSGKTTTAKRLAVQLMACGLHPHTISTDDYFVNRVDTPLDENGEYDFECIGAVDTDFFNLQMTQLLNGEEIELPRYDFTIGERVFEGKMLKIGEGDVIILEGNHALNPIMSQQIPESKKYRVYVSALTAIALDDHNYVPMIDIRLLRRILRDYQYRGYSAKETIHRCPSVTRGEDIWIIPYQENADATFNSALLYELGLIREKVLPILSQVCERDAEYAEASRLRKFLEYFAPVPAEQVPPTSLLREFAGGSSFKY